MYAQYAHILINKIVKYASFAKNYWEFLLNKKSKLLIAQNVNCKMMWKIKFVFFAMRIYSKLKKKHVQYVEMKLKVINMIDIIQIVYLVCRYLNKKKKFNKKSKKSNKFKF